MCGRLSLLTSFVLLVTFGVATLALGVPMPSGLLKVGTVIDIGNDLGYRNSMYNPRSFGDKNYIVQINTKGFGCYPVDSAIYEALANIGEGSGLRMAGPFPAADYILAAGDSGNDFFSRFDPNLNLDTRAFATDLNVRPSSYDWVDDDTIIHNSYASGLRANLYLTDVNPDPFQVTANPSWNANGYVTTGATTRIRNVRTGDIYGSYAYYGDAGTENAGFWAIDLATGVSTRLGTLNVTGSGSWGLWTVKEMDGFLYVHTTHDGIYIYNMTDATTLGTLHTRYTKDRLDALAEDTNPNWGFDVVADGARMLLSAGLGRVIEIIDFTTAFAPVPEDGTIDVIRDIELSWTPGELAATHDVYFGTSLENINAASRSNPLGVLVSQGQTAETYDPEGLLEFGQTYYWRIDEVNAAPDNTIFKGRVWSFTAEPLVYPIENITATSNATSEADAGLEETINGSGLNAMDQHSIEASDMWLGVPDGADPVYVQYEFDNVYKLHEMLLWNYNVQFELVLGFGIKDVTVEYSENGTDWTVLGDAVLAQATARPDYLYNTTIDLGGVAAQYVKLTVNSGYAMAGQYGLSEVRFMFIPAQAREPQPEDDATDVSVDTMLGWRAGRDAISHDVYFGTDSEALPLADTVDTPSYSPGALDLGATYYWKIDEVQDAESWEGDLWSFSTQEFLVVEDFESYDDHENRIYETWLDGYDVDDNGSQVGNLEAPFAETTIVNGGGQSMPLFYDNSGTTVSEAELTLAQDWTTSGIKSLSFYFQGAEGNGGQLYVKINGTKVPYTGDAGDIASPAWLPWTIDLSAVGGNLSNVTSLTIGIEGAGATGVVYIDDIELHP